MSDISDIEKSIVAFFQESLFADSVANTAGWFAQLMPSKLSVKGTPIRMMIARGEGLPDAMAKDLETGGACVFVRLESGMGSNTTRFRQEWQNLGAKPLTCSASVVGNAVTFAGSGDLYQNAGIAFQGTAYTLNMDVPTTAAHIAASFANAITNAVAVGNTVTIPTTSEVTALTNSDVEVYKETRRQRQVFCFEVFASSPAIRDVVGAELSNLISDIRSLALDDGGSTEAFDVTGTWVDDSKQKTKAYRRWDRFETEVSSGRREIHQAVLFYGVVLNTVTLIGNFSPAGPIISSC